MLREWQVIASRLAGKFKKYRATSWNQTRLHAACAKWAGACLVGTASCWHVKESLGQSSPLTAPERAKRHDKAAPLATKDDSYSLCRKRRNTGPVILHKRCTETLLSPVDVLPL